MDRVVTFIELFETLSEPIPPEMIRPRRQGGSELSYLEWHTACDLMDERCPGWQSEIREVKEVGDWVVVICRVSIPVLEGWIYREATGCERLDRTDPFSAAEAMALTRCCAKFGLGRELHSKALAMA
ncbi:MAG: DUF1071 domain-containing protein [Synechococcaceae cyanobacterium SM2_3_2]|nr:DUF1071 domain-containing protein [Synechococcaceae cyanobacterium SM2_3_2]